MRIKKDLIKLRPPSTFIKIQLHQQELFPPMCNSLHLGLSINLMQTNDGYIVLWHSKDLYLFGCDSIMFGIKLMTLLQQGWYLGLI